MNIRLILYYASLFALAAGAIFLGGESLINFMGF